MEQPTSKWIEFIEIKSKGITKIYDIVPKGTLNIIGKIKWYSPWRRYCFYFENETIFETQCLGDIINFINYLMFLRKKEKENEKFKN